MRRIIITIAALLIGAAIGFSAGAYTAIRTADYWSDGEYEDGSGFYEIGFFGGWTIHRYNW